MKIGSSVKTGTPVKTGTFANDTGMVAVASAIGVACASFAMARTASVREGKGFMVSMGTDLAMFWRGERVVWMRGRQCGRGASRVLELSR